MQEQEEAAQSFLLIGENDTNLIQPEADVTKATAATATEQKTIPVTKSSRSLNSGIHERLYKEGLAKMRRLDGLK